MFQDATLLPWRTVQKNVEFLGELEGMSKKERQVAAKEAIELVGLRASRTSTRARSPAA